MILDADYLLAIVLCEHESVSFDELDQIRLQIEKALPGTAVNLSYSAIRRALNYYPEIFRQGSGCIQRADRAAEYLFSDYVRHEFSNSIPEEVDSSVKEAVVAMFAK